VINVGYPTESSHNINMQENLSSIHLGLRRMINHTGKLFNFSLNKGGTDGNTRAPIYANAYV